MPTNFEVSYAGVPLTIATDAHRELVARYGYLDGFVPWVRPRYWRQPPLENRFPNPIWFNDPAFVLSRFFYPTHASRWSWYCGLVSGQQLAEIQASTPAASVNTFVLHADDLVHQDGVGGIQTNMIMLPPRPLGVTESPQDSLYLITLVDQRYWWQFLPVPSIHKAQLVSWESLLTQVENSLGIIVQHDSFESVYLNPDWDSDLYSNYESSALLLDAIGWNTGRILVRGFDGTFAFVPVSDVDIDDSRPPVPRYRAFGGDIYDPTEAGTVTAAINAALPTQVVVTFPQYNTDNGQYIDPERTGFFDLDSYGQVFAVAWPLSLLGTPFNAYVGVGPQKVIEDTCKAEYSGGSGPTNSDVLSSLASQLTVDHLNSKLRAVDEFYAGIRNMTPDALHDLVFDYLPPNMISTRIVPKPWDFQNWQTQHRGPLSSMCSSSQSASSLSASSQSASSQSLSSSSQSLSSLSQSLSSASQSPVSLSASPQPKSLSSSSLSSSSSPSSSSRSSSSSSSGIATACCPNGLPTTFHATLSNVTACACVSGTIVLTWDGVSNWVGTGALGTCGHQVTLTLFCRAPGGDCLSFHLDTSYPDNCTTPHGNNVQAGCSCNPVHLTFQISGAQTCGCTNIASTFQVDVTL